MRDRQGSVSAAKGVDESEPIAASEDMEFLRGLAAAVMDASRVPAGAMVGEFGPNETGGTLIRPGGRDCYPAFWIRDYAMSLGSGMATPEEQRHMLLLTAAHQRDEAWRLPSGSVVPQGAVADHITFGNKPIYYPGSLDDYEGQGGPQWGLLPCLDDHFFFVHMAAYYVSASGDSAILTQEVRGKKLLTRLEEAFAVPPSREVSGIVYADESNRGVNFGFFDTVVHTGDLLFCSVLKLRAARELAQLCERVGQSDRAQLYQAQAEALARGIDGTFAAPSGLLRASTGVSAQPDVWGTAFAVYVGALTPERERAACRALAHACRTQTIAWRGNIRHLPTVDDYSETSAWERALTPRFTYQNGAYWGTPVGWVAYAVATVDRAAARDLIRGYIEELREGDFRRGPDHGSPWECMHPRDNHRQNAVYLTSVTCPLAALERIAKEAQGGT